MKDENRKMRITPRARALYAQLKTANGCAFCPLGPATIMPSFFSTSRQSLARA
jgi:hypothetical protein